MMNVLFFSFCLCIELILIVWTLPRFSYCVSSLVDLLTLLWDLESCNLVHSFLFSKLFQIDGGSGNLIESGDTLLGDCKRDGCADAVVQALLNDNCKNKAFSIMSTDEKAWTPDEWKAQFDAL